MANAVNIKFSRCLESNLADIAIADGQVVICKDTGNIYFDFGTERIPGGNSRNSQWYTLTGGSAITLNRANGELQKVTLTQNCPLTAPVLDADNPTLLLQITSGDAVTVTIGETEVISGKSGAWQIGWYWDGSATRRYPVVEVS